MRLLLLVYKLGSQHESLNLHCVTTQSTPTYDTVIMQGKALFLRIDLSPQIEGRLLALFLVWSSMQFSFSGMQRPSRFEELVASQLAWWRRTLGLFTEQISL